MTPSNTEVAPMAFPTCAHGIGHCAKCNTEVAMTEAVARAASYAANGLDFLQYELERVIFRRALEGYLEGYTLETSKELAEVARAAIEAMRAASPSAGGEVAMTKPTDDAVERVARRENAMRFLDEAFRNIGIPPLDDADLDDVADALAALSIKDDEVTAEMADAGAKAAQHAADHGETWSASACTIYLAMRSAMRGSVQHEGNAK